MCVTRGKYRTSNCSTHLSSLVSLFSLGAGLEAVLALEMTVAGLASVRITSPDEARSAVMLQLLLFVCWSLARTSLKEAHTNTCIVCSVKLHLCHYFHEDEVQNPLTSLEKLLTNLPYLSFKKIKEHNCISKSRMTATYKLQKQNNWHKCKILEKSAFYT